MQIERTTKDYGEGLTLFGTGYMKRHVYKKTVLPHPIRHKRMAKIIPAKEVAKAINDDWNAWVDARKAFLGEHHIWCNFFLDEPAETCSMCSDLKKNYPINNQSEDELLAKHFPQVRKVQNERK